MAQYKESNTKNQNLKNESKHKMAIPPESLKGHTPDSKVHGVNMGHTWGRQDPGGTHVGHMKIAIWVGWEKGWLTDVDYSMMTSSNGNIFRVTGHLCREFTGPGELPAQRPVTRSFDVFFDLSLNKRLSKPTRGWWFETQSRPLWRHSNFRDHTRNVLSMEQITPNSKGLDYLDFVAGGTWKN